MKVRKGSITEILFIVLEKSIDGSVRFDDFAEHYYRYPYGMPHLKKSALSMAVKRLRENGYIEKERGDEVEVVLKLTNLGFEFLEERREQEWDGKYRIAIWDIPEKKRRIRDLFRRRLKDWGFKHWQGSVWVSKRNITEKLRKLVSELKMESWVAIIESDDPSLSNIKFHDR